MKTSRNMWALIIIAGFIFCMPIKSLALKVGDKAPHFAGSSTQGKIQLVDYLDKKNIVLALYFAAFTPV